VISTGSLEAESLDASAESAVLLDEPAAEELPEVLLEEPQDATRERVKASVSNKASFFFII
jgi:hypothetical protein